MEKPRKVRKPRSSLVVDMIANCHGGPHRDKRDKRAHRKNEWQKELKDYLAVDLDNKDTES